MIVYVGRYGWMYVGVYTYVQISIFDCLYMYAYVCMIVKNRVWFCEAEVMCMLHWFIQCLIACQIWSYISQIWQVLSRCYLTPKQWVFAQFTQDDPKSKMEINVLFLRYLGLHHNWDMCNAFVFDGRM